MRTTSKKRAMAGAALAGCAVAGFGGSMAFAVSAPSGSSVITACVQSGDHELRAVSVGTPCTKGEQRLAWNSRGQEGPRGAQGSRGLTGPPGPSGLHLYEAELKSSGTVTSSRERILSVTPPPGTYLVTVDAMAFLQSPSGEETSNPVNMTCGVYTGYGTPSPRQVGQNLTGIDGFGTRPITFAADNVVTITAGQQITLACGTQGGNSSPVRADLSPVSLVAVPIDHLN